MEKYGIWFDTFSDLEKHETVTTVLFSKKKKDGGDFWKFVFEEK